MTEGADAELGVDTCGEASDFKVCEGDCDSISLMTSAKSTSSGLGALSVVGADDVCNCGALGCTGPVELPP